MTDNKFDPPRIMSGDYSADMWKRINSAKTIAELRMALYVVCCRLQELESRMMKHLEEAQPKDGR